MIWIVRAAVVCLCFLSPAFADNIDDITGSNIAIPGGVTLNFSFEFDATTKTLVGTPTFTATGNSGFIADLNVSQLGFPSDPANPVGVTSIDFAGPAGGGGTTTLALGVNGLSPVVPGDLNFPNIGTYGPEMVLLDQGFVGQGNGDVTVSAMSVSEPSVLTLLLVGFAALLAGTILSRNRQSAASR
jgi:hypothetical protein